MPGGTITTLVQNIPQLTRILCYHVVPGRLKKADLAKYQSVGSVEGSPIDLTIEGDVFEVNNATIIQADVEADNGIIHVIDTVILMRPHWFWPIMNSTLATSAGA